MTLKTYQDMKSTSQENIGETCDLKVKLRSGASIVKIRPLFTYDSKYIIVASGTDIKIFSVASGEYVRTLRKHKKPVVSLQANKKNLLQVYSCSEEGIIIRWDVTEGQALKVYDLKTSSPVAAFYAPTSSGFWFFTTKIKNTDHHRLYSVILKAKKFSNKTMVLKPVLPQENTVSFGVECKFTAAVCGNDLQVYEFETKAYKRHKTGDCDLVCVSCHPTEFVVATGDNRGRVLVWASLFSNTLPTRSIYHWHTLPVADLVFSIEGSYVYSGGGEAALVKWNLNSENRHILPRLGVPICNMSISPDNNYVITAHEDNALQIITAQSKVVRIIQGLTQGHFQGSGNEKIIPTGMLFDSRSMALVMNGRPGHLQFYQIYEDRQLFNLDIVGRNIISQERDSVIVNTDVQKAAIDDKGLWLATVECWDNGEISPEIRLKFWHFDVTKQTFVLNTNVFLPHNKEVNCIKFQPLPNDLDSMPLAITTSNDNRFKIWTLSNDCDHDKKESWSCESMGYYRDLPAGDACFSEDGSLLAVAFDNIVTLWTLDSMALKAKFCQMKNDNNIRQVIFGNQSCCHLLVCHDGTMITVWNVLTLSVLWTVKCEVQYLVQDRKSDIIAAFSKNQNLFVFKPNNPNPIYFMENTSTKPIRAAIFVPNPDLPTEDDLRSSCWHKYSQLFFLNEEQNLLTITDEPDMKQENGNFIKVKLQENISMTPFGKLQAEHVITNVKTVKPEWHTSTQLKKNKVFDICPTNQNPIALCASILPTLLIPAQKTKIEHKSSYNEDEQPSSDCHIPMETSDNCKVATTEEYTFAPDFVGITDFSFLREAFHFLKKN